MVSAVSNEVTLERLRRMYAREDAIKRVEDCIARELARFGDEIDREIVLVAIKRIATDLP